MRHASALYSIGGNPETASFPGGSHSCCINLQPPSIRANPLGDRSPITLFAHRRSVEALSQAHPSDTRSPARENPELVTAAWTRVPTPRYEFPPMLVPYSLMSLLPVVLRRNVMAWAPTGCPPHARAGSPAAGSRLRLLGFISAPSGTFPSSRWRHNATSSFRARATIPIFRIRLLPPPNRSRYHWLKRLVG